MPNPQQITARDIENLVQNMEDRFEIVSDRLAELQELDRYYESEGLRNAVHTYWTLHEKASNIADAAEREIRIKMAYALYNRAVGILSAVYDMLDARMY